MIDRIRGEGEVVFLVSGGDFSLAPDLQGTLKTDILGKAMAVMKYDAVVPGERELAMGYDFVEGLSQKFPLLSCNVQYEGKDIGDPYIIIEKSGLRIGFIGLTLVKGSGRVPHGFILGEPGKSLEAVLTELKGKVDLLVGLFHTGLETGKVLATKYKSFDVVVLGHGRKKLHEPFTMGKTIVLKGESRGRSLGRLVLKIGPDRTIKENRSELIPLGVDLKDHPEMKTFIDEYDKKRKEQVEKIQSRHTELKPETP